MKVPFPRIVLKGDLLFRVMNKGPLKKSLICRFSFNTAFVTDYQLELSIKEVDPCAIKKDSKISRNFQVDLITKPYCQECSNSIPISELCSDCARELKFEVPKWKRMHQIMDQHFALNSDEINDPVSAEKFMFPETDSDKHLVL
jgi:hypothetical protein